MKKVSELTRPELDYWALMARNISAGLNREDAKNGAKLAIEILGSSPTQNWAFGGDIIEREKISLIERGDHWVADMLGNHPISGKTPLIAAMRCYVASVYGNAVPS